MAITTRQFREDAGAMAHPIRPDSYIAMDNFYTTTVYVTSLQSFRESCSILGQRKLLRLASICDCLV